MKKYQRPKVRVPVSALMIFSLAGCAALTATGGTDWTCSAYLPITWSKSDTDKTIRQVKEHNAVWKKMCQNVRDG